jgi:hypothetical protein
MQRRKSKYLLSAGLILLAASILLRDHMHSNHVEFAGGLLLGMSLVFIIAALVVKKRAGQDNGKPGEKRI